MRGWRRKYKEEKTIMLFIGRWDYLVLGKGIFLGRVEKGSRIRKNLKNALRCLDIRRDEKFRKGDKEEWGKMCFYEVCGVF